jgi:hypothetical protein
MRQLKGQYLLFFAISLFFLFFGLGHNSLWDDEANTALFGKSVWRTGDTNALLGNNLIAFREGLELKDLKNRLIPPIQYYFISPVAGIFDPTSPNIRIPFAAIAVLCLLGMFLWVSGAEKRPERINLFLFCMLGNTSWFIFHRQCRYYSLSTLLSLATIFFYIKIIKEPKNMIWFFLTLLFLLGTHYIAFFGLAVALLMDFILFGKNKKDLRKYAEIKNLLAAGIFFIGAGVIVWIFNPLHNPVTLYQPESIILDKIKLWYWNLRDLNSCQFGWLGILPISLWAFRREPFCLPFRISLGVITYAMGVSLVSPQPVGWASVADIRYMQATIPALVFLTSHLISILPWRLLPKIALCFLFCWTNVPHNLISRSLGQAPPPFQIAQISFLHELFFPNPEPYGPTARWIRNHVSPGSTIWVLPDYMTYPLMFHAPKAVYAWQLRSDQKNEEQFKSLPDIHFQGLVPPDFIVAFGPSVQHVRQLIGQWSMQGLCYQEIARLMTFWKDLYRPELFWRTFKPIENFDPNNEAIYIFQRQLEPGA